MKSNIENILNNIQAIVYSIKVDKDQNYELIFCNAQFERILGFKPQEFFRKQRSFKKNIHPDDWNEFYANYNLIFDIKESVNNIFRIKHKYNNNYIWIENKSTPILNENNEVVMINGIANDITSLKIEIEQLKVNEEKLLSLYDNVPEILFNLAVKENNNIYEYYFIEVNSSFYEATGLQESQVIGKNVKEVIPQPSLDIVLTKYEESIHTKSKVIWEEVSEYPLGNKYGEVQIKPYFNENDICTNILGIAIDRTNQKSIEIENSKILKQLEEAQSIANLGSWVLDLINNKLDWSSQIYKIFEIDSNLFAPSYEVFLNLVHPEDRNFVNTAYKESVDKKILYNIVHRLLFPDGRIKYINEICETFYNNEGLPIRSVGTAQDITDKIKLEQKYQKLFNDAPIGLMESSIDGTIKNTNIAFVNILGYDNLDDVLNTNMIDIYFDKADRVPLLNEIFEKGIIKDFELKIKNRNGYPLWVNINANIIKDYNGKPIGVEGFVLDIDKRKKSEIKLKENKIRNKIIFNESMEAIFLTKNDGTILDANPEACKMLNYTLEEIKSLGRSGIIDLNDPNLNKLLEDRKLTGKMKGSLTLIRNGGKKIYGEVSSVVFIDSDNIEKTHLVVRDISLRKIAENELKKLQYLIENSKDFVGLANLDGKVEYLNKYGKTLVELGHNEVKSKNILDFFGNDSKLEFQSTVLPTLMQQGYWYGRTQFVKFKSEDLIPIEMSAFLIRDDETGNPVALATVSRDIRARLLKEKVIKENENNLQLIFDISPVALIITRLEDGEILKLNNSTIDLFKVNIDDILNRNTLDFYVNLSDREYLVNALKEKGKLVGFELDLKNANNEVFRAMISSHTKLRSNIELFFFKFI